ncbi:MAG: hypothetical protein KAU20_02150 [Nanoarchaeota archaeon]|nr:hypothetical protein [Nanoarchaeota archaeon]
MGIVSKILDPSRKNSKNSKISLSGTGKNSPNNILVPHYIFHDRRLTPLEAVIKYLKEKRGLSYNKIAVLLNRNVRDIYKTYAHAFDKTFSKPVTCPKKSFLMPVLIFANRKLAPLEALVFHLKKLSLSYHEISILINRNQRTIWTVYQRAKKKNAK